MRRQLESGNEPSPRCGPPVAPRFAASSRRHRIRAGGWLIVTLVLTGLAVSPPSADGRESLGRWRDVNRGIDRLRAGDAEAAATAFERARLRDPGDATVQYDLGLARYRQGDFAAAARWFERALSAEPQLAFAAGHNLGNARFKAGDFAGAVAAYEQALTVRDDPETRYNLEVARRRLQEEMRQQPSDGQNQSGSGSGSGSDRSPPRSGDSQSGSGSGNSASGSGESQAGSGSGAGDVRSGSSGGGSDESGSGSGGDSGGRHGAGGGSDRAAGDRASGSGEGSGSEREGPGSASERAESGSGSGVGSSVDRSAPPATSPASIDTASRSAPTDLKDQVGPMATGRQQGLIAAPDQGSGVTPPPPPASERARAMRHLQIDPRRVRELLESLEQRERQVQMRYRREPRRRQRPLDPFSMDPEEIRDFFEERFEKPPPRPADPNVKDW